MTERSCQPFDVLADELLEGRHLIEASAGTGKTYAMALLFLRLLLEPERPPAVDGILAVTFTEAATAELRQRIRRFLEQARRPAPGNHPEIDAIRRRAEAACGAEELSRRLERAALDLDRAAVFTIHGFCHRVLRESAFESRVLFQTELASDADDLLREVVCDFWRREIAGGPTRLAVRAAQRKVTPEFLLERLPRQLWNPELRLLPLTGPVDAAELARLAAEFERRYFELGRIWPAVRPAHRRAAQPPARTSIGGTTGRA